MRPLDVHLAPARREDVPALTALERSSNPHPWGEALFHRELELPFSRLIVAWLAVEGTERPVGYLCRWIIPGQVQILNLAVDPGYRRRGIGRRLVEVVLDAAREPGIAEVILEVRLENVAALALYGSLGFQECGRRRDYYGPGEHAVLMTKRGHSQDQVCSNGNTRL